MNDTGVVPDAPPPPLPIDEARRRLAEAHRHGGRVKVAYAAEDPRQAGIHANRERLQLKYAEVGALISIADELARIGLGR